MAITLGVEYKTVEMVTVEISIGTLELVKDFGKLKL